MDNVAIKELIEKRIESVLQRATQDWKGGALTADLALQNLMSILGIRELRSDIERLEAEGAKEVAARHGTHAFVGDTNQFR